MNLTNAPSVLTNAPTRGIFALSRQCFGRITLWGIIAIFILYGAYNLKGRGKSSLPHTGKTVESSDTENRAKHRPGTPVITMTAATLQLGDLFPYGDTILPLMLKSTHGNITITDIRSSCGCMLASAEPIALDHHRERPVNVSLHPNQPTEQAVIGEDFSIELLPFAGDDLLPVSSPLRITGRFKSWGWISHSDIHMQYTSPSDLSSASRQIDLSVASNVELTPECLTYDSSIIDVRLEPRLSVNEYEKHLRRYDLGIMPHVLPIGSHKTTLKVLPQSANNLMPIIISLKISALPPIRVVPSTLPLTITGDRPGVGRTSLTSDGLPFRIERFTVTPRNLPLNVQTEIRHIYSTCSEVAFRMEGNPEADHGSVVFHVATEDGTTYDVPVTLIIVE